MTQNFVYHHHEFNVLFNKSNTMQMHDQRPMTKCVSVTDVKVLVARDSAGTSKRIQINGDY